MTQTKFLTIAVLVFGLVLTAPLASAQQSKDVLRDTFGDWEIRCIEGTDDCGMSQVGNTGDGKRALLVTIQRLKGATTPEGRQIPAAMTVQAPLGILLPYGIRLKIDAGQVVPLPLSRCVPAGCITQAPISDAAINQMKAGSNAVFEFVLDRKVPVQVSLRGFTKAFNNLQPVQARAQ